MPDMTDARFAELCQEYDAYRLEHTAEGELLILPLEDPETDAQNMMIVVQLSKWNVESGRGVVNGPSGGFLLPNGARRAPDAAWTSRQRFGRRPGVPEFVIELLSPSDRLNQAEAKMLEWLSNGVELGWLIDPGARTVRIYRPNVPQPEIHRGVASIDGEAPVVGFTLDLSAIWEI
ncbi:MAG: Uma2 family endonuclease [Bryobacteraceae bacterium]|nr:Uma2 family endonuclease [Bryobacteraceae bacterium]